MLWGGRWCTCISELWLQHCCVTNHSKVQWHKKILQFLLTVLRGSYNLAGWAFCSRLQSQVGFRSAPQGPRPKGQQPLEYTFLIVGLRAQESGSAMQTHFKPLPSQESAYSPSMSLQVECGKLFQESDKCRLIIQCITYPMIILICISPNEFLFLFGLSQVAQVSMSLGTEEMGRRHR